MIPIVILGICVGFIVIQSVRYSPAPQPSLKDVPVQVKGVVDLTPHLTEFTQIIRKGHYPNRWIINQAINEAYHSGNWRLAKSIADNYVEDYEEPEQPPPKAKEKSNVVSKEVPKEEAVEELEEKAPLFLVQKTSSPIDGVNNDDWRMFVEASRIEDPAFNSPSSMGMFRQNKKRLSKLGIKEEILQDPITQYDAFEKEVSMLMDEGKEVFKQSVAMPISIDGDNTPMTLSGLLAVMRSAGTANAAKWIDSEDERRKFPNTTEAFKRANGCF
jgi:hypothetical protein